MKASQDLAPYYETKNPATNAYYDAFAQRQAANPRAVMWNWSAFFLGPLWLFYRKAYRAAALLLVADLAACMTVQNVPFDCLAIVAMGLFGNNIYFWDMRRRGAPRPYTTGTCWKSTLLIGAPLAILIYAVCAYFLTG